MDKNQNYNMNKITDRIISFLKFRDYQKRDDEAEMWSRITGEIAEKEKSVQRQKRIQRIYMTVSAVAACTFILLYIGKVAFVDEDNSLDKYISRLSDTSGSVQQVQLLLSGQKAVCMDQDSVGIIYSPEGEVQINGGRPADSETRNENAEGEEFNQIVVPKGKYTHLMLSDGTRMHVNSGSMVVYPRVFVGERREIYVEGEVFLEVTPDKKKPFIVKTYQCEVEVLGTSFNINAYKQNRQAEVVLVEGAVKLSDKHDNEVLMKPDNLVTVDSGRMGKVRRVNAKDYTAWIEGLLILHAEPLKSVFGKLERFYDVPIVVDPAIQMEIVDGKLDLSLPLPELIRLISVVSPIDYQLDNGTYYIGNKKK